MECECFPFESSSLLDSARDFLLRFHKSFIFVPHLCFSMRLLITQSRQAGRFVVRSHKVYDHCSLLLLFNHLNIRFRLPRRLFYYSTIDDHLVTHTSPVQHLSARSLSIHFVSTRVKPSVGLSLAFPKHFSFQAFPRFSGSGHWERMDGRRRETRKKKNVTSALRGSPTATQKKTARERELLKNSDDHSENTGFGSPLVPSFVVESLLPKHCSDRGSGIDVDRPPDDTFCDPFGRARLMNSTHERRTSSAQYREWARRRKFRGILRALLASLHIFSRLRNAFFFAPKHY
jgi:hypothetical protein